MTWTYGGNPAASDSAAIRFLIGDTVSSAPLITDEEIAWALTQNSNVYGAAEIIVNSLASKFATLSDVTVGPIKVVYTTRAENYLKMAKSFKYKAEAKASLDVYGGGISYADEETQNEDTDRIQPSVFTGLTDYEANINLKED
jgi:hypothetical protein